MMHGPWHMPEHPDERDNAEGELADELAHLEAFADGEPATIDDLEDCECLATTTKTYCAAPIKSVPNRRDAERSEIGSALITKPAGSAPERRLSAASTESGAATTAQSGRMEGPEPIGASPALRPDPPRETSKSNGKPEGGK